MATSKNNSKNKNNKKGSSNKNSTKLPFSKDIYQNLIQIVSVVTLNPETINLLKTENIFYETIIYYTNAIYTYEQSSKSKENKAKDFIQAINTITNKSAQLKKLTKSEIEELDDKLSYIDVFIKNTLKREWADIVASMLATKAQVLSPTNTQTTNTQTDNKKTENVEAQRFEQQSSSHFNAEEFMRQNNVSMEQIAETVITQQATMLIKNDIKNNKYYQYNSKPTFFIWIKWILFFLWVLTAVGILITSFAPFGSDKDYLYILSDTLPEPNKDFGSLISDHIFLQKFSGVSIFGLLMSLMLPLLIIYYAYSQIKNYKNDNARYSCKTFVTWILLMYMIFMLASRAQNLSDIFNISRLHSYSAETFGGQTELPVKLGESTETVYINQAKAFSILLTMFIGNMFYIISVTLSVFASIAVIITRPKLDIERFNQLLEKYKQDIKNGNIKLDNDINGTGYGFRNPFSPF